MEQKTAKLSDLASIYVGKRIAKDDYAESGIPCFRAKDFFQDEIKASGYVKSELCVKYANYLLQEEDIVLVRFGRSKHKFVIVDESYLPALVSEHFFIIRPSSVGANYLYRFLSSKTGSQAFANMLEEIKSGSALPTIKCKDLCNLDIPVYSYDVMESLDQVESMSKDELIDFIATYDSYVNDLPRNQIGNKLEQMVYAQLVEAGWGEENIIYSPKVGRYEIDMQCNMPDGRSVYIEIKTKLSGIKMDFMYFAMHEYKMRTGETDRNFYIITTGNYYEIYRTGLTEVLKMTEAPTVDDLLLWERSAK